MSEMDTKTDPRNAPEQVESLGSGPIVSSDRIETSEPETGKSKPDHAAQPVVPPAIHECLENSIEPDTPQPAKSHEERFAVPASFEDRFILTRADDRQDISAPITTCGRRSQIAATACTPERPIAAPPWT